MGKKGSPAKKGKTKNPWSDSDADDVSGSDLSDVLDDVPVAPREKAGGRRAAANIKFDKYNSDDEDQSDSEEEMFENDGVEEVKTTKKINQSGFDEEDSDADVDIPSPPPKKKPAPKKQSAITDSFKPKSKAADSDSEEEYNGKMTNGKQTNGKTNGAAKDSDKDEFDVSDSGSDFGGGQAKKKNHLLLRKLTIVTIYLTV